MENKTIYYTSEQIYKKFLKLSLQKRNEVLYEAIDFMQQYNGRSRFLCIAMAMGYENYEDRIDSYIKKQ
jgi:uncharacterized protein YeeX (DUF496 family)